MGKKTEFGNSFKINNETYIQYYNRLTDVALSVFEWKGLPDTIDVRFLELCLISDGMCVFFKDEVLGYLALQVMIGGRLDVYRIPMQRRAYASNGYQMELNASNSVIIFNNQLHTNSLLDIELYAQRLYEIERTIDVNVKAQKTPVLIKSTENQRLVMQNLYQKYDGNQPYIFGDKNLDISQLEVLKTDAPFVADKLQELKRKYWNEYLTINGVENDGQEKKERLVSQEMDSNLGGVRAMGLTKLNARQYGAEQLNRMFGLNASVDFKKNLHPVVDEKIDVKETKKDE